MISQEPIQRRSKAFTTRRSVSTGRRKKVPPHIVAKQEAAREKQVKALELRKAGATYSEIASALLYTDPSAAHKAVKAAMNRVVLEASKDAVLMDLQRLDEFQMRCTQKMRAGDLSQVDRLLRIMDARYRLAGISPQTAEELRENFGVTTQIKNSGVMVVQVGHNQEQDFVKKLMAASGVDVTSSEAQEYLENLNTGPQKEIEGSTAAPKKRTVRVKRKSGKVTAKNPATPPPTPTHPPISRSHAPSSTEGGIDERHAQARTVYGEPEPAIPALRRPSNVLDEEEVIDAEIV